MASRRTSKGRASDIEMQEDSLQAEINLKNEQRTQALKDLFGYSTEQVQIVPSATAWCNFLEECFQPFLEDEYATIMTSIGLARPRVAADCWPWLGAVASTIFRQEDAGTSIDDIWEDMIESHGATPLHPRKESKNQKSACLIAVFAVLCWGSMTLSPRLVWPEGTSPNCLALQHLKPEHQGLKMDFAQRPIAALFKNLQRSRVGHRWRPPINAAVAGDATVLYVSSLNFSSLQVMGKIRLKWVDNINAHLDFDSRTRTLSIFRYPSFCALTTLCDNRGVLFEELTRALYSMDADTGREYECNLQLNQEVLMSYRILFGQANISRKLAKKELHVLRQQRPKDYDELLDSLCCDSRKDIVKKVPTSLWPVSCRDYDNVLQQADSYSSPDDFPMFGQRLAAIQAFNLRQQPSKLRDLWRDRRNPLQWYTFWAVLIVGGASIVIAVLQLIVSIVAIPTSMNNVLCSCPND